MTDNDRLRGSAGEPAGYVGAVALSSDVTLRVESDDVRYLEPEGEIRATYRHASSHVRVGEGADAGAPSVVRVSTTEKVFEFRTKSKPRKLGLMQVGWGGNNGSTVTAAVLANRSGTTWATRTGTQTPNFFGTLTQASTMRVGSDDKGRDVFAPMSAFVPLVEPTQIVLSGWDISGLNLKDAMLRAQVLEPDLIRQLAPEAEKMVPLRAAYDESFIAQNQKVRADNIMESPAYTKRQMLEQLRADIREFKQANALEFVVVVWTANSERYSEVRPELNGCADTLLASIEKNDAEVSPSTLYAVASILEGCPYINGSPQNTFVPGCLELAEQHGVLICGDDFKSGQTKMKSVLCDYLIGCGIKIKTMVTYNHLGNNDMYQLTDGVMWKPKSASKSRVIEDVVQSNGQLYSQPGEMPDHVVVVKYVEFLGDSKRDVSEYTSEGFMNGHYTSIIHNSCLDSILCAPLILDLAILAELFDRVRVRPCARDAPESSEFVKMHPILSVLSFYMKIPLVRPEEPIINSLNRQKSCLENMIRALVGLPPENHLLLDTKIARDSTAMGS
ncbi:Inositol-3-phosphate synthase [Porphyridium purpureum]|uniref:inositol-3-phosphate synthase n=1 Tax=Porphyridium purpureum TaxID=35688 RepID=A0A5J4YU66_PORPP|nr:Inositol-3-phosphate synthase [Porphyridium purpureum]|eukprot:POR5559..scf227_4